jgi:hypothetical protein
VIAASVVPQAIAGRWRAGRQQTCATNALILPCLIRGPTEVFDHVINQQQGWIGEYQLVPLALGGSLAPHRATPGAEEG